MTLRVRRDSWENDRQFDEILTLANEVERLSVVRDLFAVKTVDTARASTIVLADDPHLSLILELGVWHLDSYLNTVGSDGDLQWGWSFSGAFSASTALTLAPLSGTPQTQALTTTIVTRPGIFSVGLTVPTGAIVEVTTIGKLTLRWAQQTSHVNATTIGKGSFVTARKLV
jgi:hypothetical protein